MNIIDSLSVKEIANRQRSKADFIKQIGCSVLHYSLLLFSVGLGAQVSESYRELKVPEKVIENLLKEDTAKADTIALSRIKTDDSLVYRIYPNAENLQGLHRIVSGRKDSSGFKIENPRRVSYNGLDYFTTEYIGDDAEFLPSGRLVFEPKRGYLYELDDAKNELRPVSGKVTHALELLGRSYFVQGGIIFTKSKNGFERVAAKYGPCDGIYRIWNTPTAVAYFNGGKKPELFGGSIYFIGIQETLDKASADGFRPHDTTRLVYNVQDHSLVLSNNNKVLVYPAQGKPRFIDPNTVIVDTAITDVDNDGLYDVIVSQKNFFTSDEICVFSHPDGKSKEDEPYCIPIDKSLRFRYPVKPGDLSWVSPGFVDNVKKMLKDSGNKPESK